MRNKTINLYTEWKPLIDALSNEDAGRLLKDILKYQNGEPVENNNPVWLFIKSKIDDYNKAGEQMSKARSIAGKIGMEKRWGITKITSDNKDNKCYQMIANDNKNNNKIKENKIKQNKRKENNIKEKKFGELGMVNLTQEQYDKLSAEHNNLQQAIEALDTWLGGTTKSARQARNGNHYAYFKSNSWVWDRITPTKEPKRDVFYENLEKMKQMNQKYENEEVQNAVCLPF